MKKLSILAVTVILAASLTACGTNGDNGDAKNNDSGNNGGMISDIGSDIGSDISGITDGLTNGDEADTGESDGQSHFDATVVEIDDNELTVRPETGNGSDADSAITGTDRITVSTNVTSGDSVPSDLKEGDRVRVVYSSDGMNASTSRIDTVFAVYKLDESGNPITSR